MMRHLGILLVLSVFYACDTYKVMVIFPLPGKSHMILCNGIIKHLMDAGHEVTVVTSLPLQQQHPQLREIYVSVPGFQHSSFLNLTALLETNIGPISINDVLPLNINITHSILASKKIQNILHDPNEHFDAVIPEWFFSELFSGIANVFGCPLIWFSSLNPHWIILSLIDELPNPAYVPDIMSNSLHPFTFSQRLQELLNQIEGYYTHHFYLHKIDDEAYQKYLVPAIVKRGIPAPDYATVKFNASLILANSHVSVGHSVRLPQNFKQIAGYHIDKNVKPLPEELKIIMDHSKHGVIYFSMGSNLKSSTMPNEIKQNLLKMFGELKQTVLWKFEVTIPNVPKNVHILSWAPQQSILAHPNCKIFISHGGLLSTTETVHFGVPIIGIPVFADQFVNVGRAAAMGYAIAVQLSHNIAQDLKNAIEEMLSNPRYTNKVKELSFIYHDRPASPDKELVHWVEHVIRTKGAPHLRSLALEIPWYQKMYIDLVGIIIVIGITMYTITKKLMRRIFGSRSRRFNSKKTD